MHELASLHGLHESYESDEGHGWGLGAPRMRYWWNVLLPFSSIPGSRGVTVSLNTQGTGRGVPVSG